MIGQTFNRLTILECVGTNKFRRKQYLCQCSCGTQKILDGQSIKQGSTKSCGCWKIESDRTKIPGNTLKGKNDSTINSLFSRYKKEALKRNLTFNLTREYFENLLRSCCHYCGIEHSNTRNVRKNAPDFKYNGIDRVDNTKGYEADNVVSCCNMCNKSKHILSVKEFIIWVTRINHYQLKPYTDFYINTCVLNSYKEHDEINTGGRKDKLPHEYGVVSTIMRKYKLDACKRNILFELSRDKFEKLLRSPCFYCGVIFSLITKNGHKLDILNHNGIDRKDNTMGYTTENAVSCCKDCNTAKNKHTEQQFLSWAFSVFSHNKSVKEGER